MSPYRVAPPKPPEEPLPDVRLWWQKVPSVGLHLSTAQAVVLSALFLASWVLCLVYDVGSCRFYAACYVVVGVLVSAVHGLHRWSAARFRRRLARAVGELP